MNNVIRRLSTDIPAEPERWCHKCQNFVKFELMALFQHGTLQYQPFWWLSMLPISYRHASNINISPEDLWENTEHWFCQDLTLQSCKILSYTDDNHGNSYSDQGLGLELGDKIKTMIFYCLYHFYDIPFPLWILGVEGIEVVEGIGGLQLGRQMKTMSREYHRPPFPLSLSQCQSFKTQTNATNK